MVNPSRSRLRANIHGVSAPTFQHDVRGSSVVRARDSDREAQAAGSFGIPGPSGFSSLDYTIDYSLTAALATAAASV